jgi:anti-sigma regulatory factor (Ser/Thr protein kinase)
MSEPILPSVSLSLSSDPRDVERLLTSLESTLAESCLDEMSAFHLRCAVVEVVNNCIQHAYKNKSGQPIEITYALAPDRVQVTISDRGPPFAEPAEPSELSLMDESGRGLQIIKAWVSSLKFERKNDWNFCLLEQRVQH